MFIDTETGTIVNGPVFYVDDAWIDALDNLSDSEVSDFALSHGTRVGPAPTAGA